MTNLKNLHLLWIITISSAITVLLCLLYLFSESANKSSISNLSSEFMKADKVNAQALDVLREQNASILKELKELKNLQNDMGALHVAIKGEVDALRKRLDAILQGIPRPVQPAAGPAPAIIQPVETNLVIPNKAAPINNDNPRGTKND